MTLNFKYKVVTRPNGTTSKTPSIPIILSGKERFETMGLLDSGADVSAIPQAVAEILGLDLNGKKEHADGIGGRVECIETKIIMMLEKGHEHYSFTIPVKVILGDYDFPILLGRTGFFNKFIISFNEKDEKVTLKWNERR